MNIEQALENIDKVIGNSNGNREYHLVLQTSYTTVREELNRLRAELTTAQEEVKRLQENGAKAK